MVCPFINSMTQDNASSLKQLPYYLVPISELQNDFGYSTIAQAVFINNDFLNEVKNSHCSDLLHN